MSYDRGEGLGIDFVALASKLQSGANRFAGNLQTVAGKIQAIQAKGNAILDTTTRAAVTAGEVAKATTRAGIATAATGDEASGLTAAAATTKPLLIGGGILAAVWLFAKHPGHRRW